MITTQGCHKFLICKNKIKNNNKKHSIYKHNKMELNEMKYACISNFSSSSYHSNEGQDFIVLYLIP